MPKEAIKSRERDIAAVVLLRFEARGAISAGLGSRAKKYGNQEKNDAKRARRRTRN